MTLHRKTRAKRTKRGSQLWKQGYFRNETQLNEHLWTQVLKHLNVHIHLVTIAYQYYNQLISRTDLSPIPVRSAAKSYVTS